MNSRILPTLALFIAISIFFAYVHPTWSGSIAETREKIALNDQALVAAAEYTTRQGELIAERDAIDPAMRDSLETFLPDSVDNVRLILDLNALAARSGLSIANIDVVMNDSSASADPATEALGALSAATSPVGSVNLSLSAVGTFSALQAFLNGIEKSARLLDVQDIVVKSSDTGVYSYQMILRLYWLR